MSWTYRAGGWLNSHPFANQTDYLQSSHSLKSVNQTQPTVGTIGGKDMFNIGDTSGK